MSEFNVTWRAATQRDIVATEKPEDLSYYDGASALEINGELVACCNEYGTAVLVAGTDKTPTREAVEVLNEAFIEFYGTVI